MCLLEIRANRGRGELGAAEFGCGRRDRHIKSSRWMPRLGVPVPCSVELSKRRARSRAQSPRSQVRMWQHVGQQLPTLTGLLSSSNNATVLMEAVF